MTLKEIAQLALAEDACPIPIDKCRSPNGPANCRVHCVEYFDRLCDSVTFEEAAKGLKDQFNVDCVPLEDLSKVVKDPQLVAEVNKRAHATTPEDFHRACKSLYVCMSDLKSRFPDIQFPQKGLCIGGIPNNENDVLLSTVDSTFGGMGMIILSGTRLKSDNRGYYFGHFDARNQSDLIRHEIGHWITDKAKLTIFRRLINAVTKIKPSEDVGKKLKTNVSDYAAESFSAEDDKEVVAEIFSKYTSPDYQKGNLDIVLEIFVENQLLK